MKATKICRVCGKEYEACHTFRRPADGFRWQDVACSPECGAIYLNRILVSRGQIAPEDASEEDVEDDIDFGVDDEDIPEDDDLDIYI